jgi:hypothetical protein
MTDPELILYLCRLLWDDISDGDTPMEEDWDTLRDELSSRDIDPDEIFGY